MNRAWIRVVSYVVAGTLGLYVMAGILVSTMMYVDFRRVGNDEKPLFGKESRRVFDSGTVEYDCCLYNVMRIHCENGDPSSPGGPGGYFFGTTAHCTLGKYLVIPLVLRLDNVRLVR